MVGLSGGVDSAVTALLLREQGYQVQAMFMKNWDEDDGTEYCTAQADYADAQRVAEHLGIELHAANFAAEYWDNVFEHFLTEYAAGRTPNPDVLCNREIKFKQFLDYARLLGADLIATGHYVRGHWTQTAAGEPGHFQLLKGVDPNKDQSYFLQSVPLAQLAPSLFPLGELHKDQVRDLARQAGLHNHARKDSTGICFIGERRLSDFLGRYLATIAGPIVDTAGRTIGEHHGLAFFTVGQRQGLGIGGQRGAREAPWYVLNKDLDRNTLVVTQDERDLLSDWLLASDMNWLIPEPGLPRQCTAKVRYRQSDQPCAVSQQDDGQLLVHFDQPQRAVAPGQYVCLYQGDLCLGGARIQACGRSHADSSTASDVRPLAERSA